MLDGEGPHHGAAGRLIREAPRRLAAPTSVTVGSNRNPDAPLGPIGPTRSLMDDPTTLTVTLAAADLVEVMDELPAETAGRLQVILDALVYERVVLCREGHQPPFELSAFDVRQIENAVERLPGTEDERRAARSVEPG